MQSLKVTGMLSFALRKYAQAASMRAPAVSFTFIRHKSTGNESIPDNFYDERVEVDMELLDVAASMTVGDLQDITNVQDSKDWSFLDDMASGKEDKKILKHRRDHFLAMQGLSNDHGDLSDVDLSEVDDDELLGKGFDLDEELHGRKEVEEEVVEEEEDFVNEPSLLPLAFDEVEAFNYYDFLCGDDEMEDEEGKGSVGLEGAEEDVEGEDDESEEDEDEEGDENEIAVDGDDDESDIQLQDDLGGIDLDSEDDDSLADDDIQRKMLPTILSDELRHIAKREMEEFKDDEEEEDAEEEGEGEELQEDEGGQDDELMEKFSGGDENADSPSRRCPGKLQRKGKTGILRCHKIDLDSLTPFDVMTLRNYLTADSEIMGKNLTGLCTKCQRNVAKTIKRARNYGIIPHLGHFEIEPAGMPRAGEALPKWEIERPSEAILKR